MGGQLSCSALLARLFHPTIRNWSVCVDLDRIFTLAGQYVWTLIVVIFFGVFSVGLKTLKSGLVIWSHFRECEAAKAWQHQQQQQQATLAAAAAAGGGAAGEGTPPSLPLRDDGETGGKGRQRVRMGRRRVGMGRRRDKYLTGGSSNDTF